MLLSDTDARNASQIKESTDARSKAHALSIALALTRFVVEQIMKGNELLVRNKDGKLERVIMPELENIRNQEGRVQHSSG
ncbi:hypothetical protein BB934_45790 (plasmid) [Microvirga ossetica]|uniref:Uncharacterized protein n=2 Tax=Microvirga ossetica TaxID=1882682 RepID=A0A1B2F014_9HYPH|nr:hypothetical protein BB934_45790 [Microvirga ossetica]